MSSNVQTSAEKPKMQTRFERGKKTQKDSSEFFFGFSLVSVMGKFKLDQNKTKSSLVHIETNFVTDETCCNVPVLHHGNVSVWWLKRTTMRGVKGVSHSQVQINWR